MTTSRRHFLKQSALTLAASAFASHALYGGKPGDEIVGLQLYSVRDEMKKDPLGTLKQLADMGYKHLEHANYIDRKFYGYSAKEFKKIINDLGMDMPSGHTVLGAKHWDASKKDFTDVWKYTVEDAAAIGQEYVISPSLEKEFWKSGDALKGFMEVFNKAGDLCKKSGMQFGYHNHDFEFSQKLDGRVMYDIMLEETDPALVIQQLDIGNLYNGGATAKEIVTKLPGRFQSFHVKDEIKSSEGNDKYEITILGAGIVPVKEVIDIGRKSGGTRHFIIEQEAYQGKTPLACMKENLVVMKKWGYK